MSVLHNRFAKILDIIQSVCAIPEAPLSCPYLSYESSRNTSSNAQHEFVLSWSVHDESKHNLSTKCWRLFRLYLRLFKCGRHTTSGSCKVSSDWLYIYLLYWNTWQFKVALIQMIIYEVFSIITISVLKGLASLERCQCDLDRANEHVCVTRHFPKNIESLYWHQTWTVYNNKRTCRLVYDYKRSHMTIIICCFKNRAWRGINCTVVSEAVRW